MILVISSNATSTRVERILTATSVDARKKERDYVFLFR